MERGLFLIEKRLLKWNVALDSNVFDKSKNLIVLRDFDPVPLLAAFLRFLAKAALLFCFTTSITTWSSSSDVILGLPALILSVQHSLLLEASNP